MLTQANHTRCKETNRLRWIKHVIIEHNEQQSSSTISHEIPLNTTKHRPSSNNIINDQTSILQTSWDFQVPLETIFSILHIISYVFHSTKTPNTPGISEFLRSARVPAPHEASTSGSHGCSQVQGGGELMGTFSTAKWWWKTIFFPFEMVPLGDIHWFLGGCTPLKIKMSSP